MSLIIEDTIVAPATASGIGAIALIRISGAQAFTYTQAIFKGKDLLNAPSHTVHFGVIHDKGSIVDEVLVTLFKAPKSFTKENVIEISCHGSPYIVKKILGLLIREGARMAQPGEFTKRAFLNGQFDLAQAEAVADVIASESEATHRNAIHQMRGGFSKDIKRLREALIHFASMIELELDFSEEDVEFAKRQDLKDLIYDLLRLIHPLVDSFALGNVIKNGVPIAIIGRPNAGKSTLLNRLLNEERAIVSEIAGTTRDTIEDELVIEGICFRLIDTAGIRKTDDTVESLGIQRSFEKAKEALLVLYLFDAEVTSQEDVLKDIISIGKKDDEVIVIANKIDRLDALNENLNNSFLSSLPEDWLSVSAKDGSGIDLIKIRMLNKVLQGQKYQDKTLVSNVRHYEALIKTSHALEKVLEGIDHSITGDFLALDIRQALYHLGLITGDISTEDLLDNIFSKFCIGK